MEYTVENVPAFIMAAGKGTRLREYSYGKSKPVIEIAGKPMISHIIDNLIFTGIKKIFIVKYAYDPIEEEIASYYKNIKVDLIFIQDYMQKGSLYSFSLIEPYVDYPYIFVDADIMCNPFDFKSMIKYGLNLLNSKCEVDGLMTLVKKPLCQDADMLIMKGNRIIKFNKKGVINGKRGGYVYIWNRNFSIILHEFLEIGCYSLSEFLKEIVMDYTIEAMPIDTLWDIDNREDIIFTNQMLDHLKM